MDSAHRRALAARGDFNAAVCDLHKSGASLRGIADALDLSHQRVHQIVGAEPSFWARMTRRAPRPRQPASCSFCGRSQGEAKKLVAGPGVYICDGCIRSLNPGLEASVDARCSFCGKSRREVPIATGPDVRICGSCLDLCHEVLAEGA